MFFFSSLPQVFISSPRYTLFIHLVINDMIQLLLSTLLHVVSYAFYTINVSLCIVLLLISITTTLNTPLNLAGMAVECYVAIGLPLRHSQICTIRNTYIFIGLVWTAGTVSILPDALILVATEPVPFFYSRVLCIRDQVFRSSYSLKKRNASHILCLILVWLVLFFTYFRILFAAKGANKDFRKARNTILLHGFQMLLCMLSYIRPMFENAMQVLVSSKYLSAIGFCSYIISLILPRFISPIVYGLRDQTFRKFTSRYLLCKTR